MGKFAWRNLLTRPLRTVLALVGLSVPILGVLGLFSLSRRPAEPGRQHPRQDQGGDGPPRERAQPRLQQAPRQPGREDPAVPGVRVVAPEVWGLPPTIEDVSLIPRNPLEFLTKTKEQKIQSFLDATVIQGQDIAAHQRPQQRGVSRARSRKGGSSRLDDRDEQHRDQPEDRQGAPGRLGQAQEGGRQAQDRPETFTIIGIYETGSMLLDLVIVMDIDTARKVAGRVSTTRSRASTSRPTTPEPNDEVAADRGDDHRARLDARSMNEFMANFGP